jgi:hypothetical protein
MTNFLPMGKSEADVTFSDILSAIVGVSRIMIVNTHAPCHTTG